MKKNFTFIVLLFILVGNSWGQININHIIHRDSVLDKIDTIIQSKFLNQFASGFWDSMEKKVENTSFPFIQKDGPQPPIEFNLYGGGNYCEGSPGLQIYQDGSEAGVYYELFLDWLPNYIASQCGSGGPLDWGYFPAGDYGVLATGLWGLQTFMCCGISIIMDSLPLTPGPITGSNSVTEGSQNIPYSISDVQHSNSYLWSYSGNSVTINGTGKNVMLNFATGATSGQLAVNGVNVCGNGPTSVLEISVDTIIVYPEFRTLTINFFLEGLLKGDGLMSEAKSDINTYRWGAGIADKITVELHDAANYDSIVFKDTNIFLGTNGIANITLPGYLAFSFYITVKHRNSIETVSYEPISFANIHVDSDFTSQWQAYEQNLKQLRNGYAVIYVGDINQDGVVDGTDMMRIDNASILANSGYCPEDINGDSFVDGADMTIIFNNSSFIAQKKIP